MDVELHKPTPDPTCMRARCELRSWEQHEIEDSPQKRVLKRPNHSLRQSMVLDEHNLPPAAGARTGTRCPPLNLIDAFPKALCILGGTQGGIVRGGVSVIRRRSRSSPLHRGGHAPLTRNGSARSVSISCSAWERIFVELLKALDFYRLALTERSDCGSESTVAHPTA